MLPQAPRRPPITQQPAQLKSALLQRLEQFSLELNKISPMSVGTLLGRKTPAQTELVDLINSISITNINNLLTDDFEQLIQLLTQLVKSVRSLVSNNKKDPAQSNIVHRAYTYCIHTILANITSNNKQKLDQFIAQSEKEQLEPIKAEVELITKYNKLITYLQTKESEVANFFRIIELSSDVCNLTATNFRLCDTPQELVLHQIFILNIYAFDLIHHGVDPTRAIDKALSLIDSDDDFELEPMPPKPLEIVISDDEAHDDNGCVAVVKSNIGKILIDNIQEVNVIFNQETKDFASAINLLLLYAPLRSMTISGKLPSSISYKTRFLNSERFVRFFQCSTTITNFKIRNQPIAYGIQEVLVRNRAHQAAQQLEEKSIQIVEGYCQDEKQTLESMYSLFKEQNLPPVTFCIAWALKGPSDNLRSVFQGHLRGLRKNQNNRALDLYYQALIKRTEELIKDDTKTLSDVYQYLSEMNLDDFIPYWIDELYCAAWVEKKRAFPNDNTHPSKLLLHLFRATRKLLAEENLEKLASNTKSFEDVCSYFCAYPSLTSFFAFEKLFPLIKETSHPFHHVAKQTLRRLASSQGVLQEKPDQKLQRQARLIIVDEHINLDDNHNITEWIKIYFKDLCNLDSQTLDRIKTLADLRRLFPELYLKLQAAVLTEKKRLGVAEDSISVTLLEILETAAVLKSKMKCGMVEVLKNILQDDPEKIVALHREITDITRLPALSTFRQVMKTMSPKAAQPDKVEEKINALESYLQEESHAKVFYNFFSRVELELNSDSLILNSLGKCILTELATENDWRFIGLLARKTNLQLDLESTVFRELLNKVTKPSVETPVLDAFRVLIQQARPSSPTKTSDTKELPIVIKEPILVTCLKLKVCCDIFTMLVEKGLDPNVEVEIGQPIFLYCLHITERYPYLFALLEKSPTRVHIPEGRMTKQYLHHVVISAGNTRLLAGLLKHGVNPTTCLPADNQNWDKSVTTCNAMHHAACSVWNNLSPEVQSLAKENAALSEENAALKRELEELKRAKAATSTQTNNQPQTNRFFIDPAVVVARDQSGEPKNSDGSPGTLQAWQEPVRFLS